MSEHSGLLSNPIPGFDLLPHRAARTASRKRRCRSSVLFALTFGLVGALALQWLLTRQQRADHERRQRVEQRLLALAPALEELRVLEARVSADDARRARLLRLEPRRRQMVRLLDALSEAAQDGIAITSVGFSHDDDGIAVARITGLSDDADAVARWASAFAGHVAIGQVEVDELRRLDRTPAQAAPAVQALRLDTDFTGHMDHAASPDRAGSSSLGAPIGQGLNTFRITARLLTPLVAPVP